MRSPARGERNGRECFCRPCRDSNRVATSTPSTDVLGYFHLSLTGRTQTPLSLSHSRRRGRLQDRQPGPFVLFDGHFHGPLGLFQQLVSATAGDVGGADGVDDGCGC
ncbi:MAG: hypothetical protein FD138_2215 [Planctomycetota bacterium]|nr:MAG: hypothetical protein FD138_2215 [Planctomycetota bacterium]